METNTTELNILHCGLSLKRGIGSVIANLAVHQAKLHNVAVFVGDDQLSDPDQGLEGVAYSESVAMIEAAKTFSDPSPDTFAALSQRFTEETEDFDVVYLHGVVPMCLGAFAVRGNRTKQVAYMHGSENFLYGTNSGIWYETFQSAPNGLRYAICVTDVEEEFAAKLIPAAKRTVIGNAIDTDIFSPDSPAQPPENDFLFMRSLSRLTGADLFVGALHRLPQTFRAAIVGTGPDRKTIEEQIKLYGLQQNVSMYPETNAPIEWLHKSECVVLPSRAEGMSMSMLEALAAGNIVIATEVGGSAIVREAGGILVPPDNISELAGAMATVASLGARQKTGMSLQARDYVVRHHSLPVWYQQHDALLAKIVSGSI